MSAKSSPTQRLKRMIAARTLHPSTFKETGSFQDVYRYSVRSDYPNYANRVESFKTLVSEYGGIIFSETVSDTVVRGKHRTRLERWHNVYACLPGLTHLLKTQVHIRAENEENPPPGPQRPPLL